MRVVEAGKAGQIVHMGHHLPLVGQGVAAVLGALQEGLQQPGLLLCHRVLPDVPLEFLHEGSFTISHTENLQSHIRRKLLASEHLHKRTDDINLLYHFR